MLMKNWKSKLQRAIAGLSVSGLVWVSIMAASPATAAYAAPATPPAQPQRNERLEQAYQREQEWLGTQQDNLNRMNSAADRLQQFIATQQSKGKDVSALQAALSTFRSQIASAQASHATADSVLGTRLGFDGNGKVTDAAQARQTLLDARQALRDAHHVMRQAVLNLHRAIRTWRQANGLQVGQPSATPAN